MPVTAAFPIRLTSVVAAGGRYGEVNRVRNGGKPLRLLQPAKHHLSFHHYECFTRFHVCFVFLASRCDTASSSGYESMRNDTSQASSDSCSERGFGSSKKRGEPAVLVDKLPHVSHAQS